MVKRHPAHSTHSRVVDEVRRVGTFELQMEGEKISRLTLGGTFGLVVATIFTTHKIWSLLCFLRFPIFNSSEIVHE